MHRVKVRLALAGLTLLATVGCQSHPPAPTSATPAVAPVAVKSAPTTAPSADTASSASDSSGALAEALSRKTAAYANSLDSANQPLLPLRHGKKQPSGVDWDPAPAAGRASAGGAAVKGNSANVPLEKMAAINAPAANAPAVAPPPAASPPPVASRSDGAGSDGPAIVPESADFATPASGRLSPAGLPAAAPAAPAGDPLQEQVAQRQRNDPHDVAAQLDGQLLLMIEDAAAPQVAAMAGISTEDQELINTLVDGLTNFRTTVRQDENLLLADKIRPLLAMADRLRSQADLSIPTACLCRRVDSFGRYDPIEPARFKAGQENPALVYCEIENFLPRQNSQKMWETHLSQRVTLFTDTGMVAWKGPHGEVIDDCRNRRHDFYLVELVRLPANLTIGRYVLKITVTDRNANRVAERTVPLEIAAQDASQQAEVGGNAE